MKVLLVGEYSGFFTNLKKGLIEEGVECDLVSNGDVWKKIKGSDYRLFDDTFKKGIKKFINTVVIPFKNRNRFKGYDVVQFVNPNVYPRLTNQFMFKALKKNNKKIFVSIAGDGVSVYQSYKKGILDYYIYDDNDELVNKYEKNNLSSVLYKKNEKYVLKNVDGIIPIMYEYAVGVRELNNTKETVPLPFDCESIKYVENKVKNDKIVIFHGIIREKAKGSNYIIEALKIIKDKYPNQVEVVIDGKMPLEKYLEYLKGVNILVDQCKEHCYSMNALYAMAEGRIVLSGASQESLDELGVDQCPVIHIGPNVKQIVDCLEILISKKEDYPELGKQSRKYVESFHDCRCIAKEYIRIWNDCAKDTIMK